MIAGTAADALRYGGAIAIVAGLTAASGLWALANMPSAPRLGGKDASQPAAGERASAASVRPVR